MKVIRVAAALTLLVTVAAPPARAAAPDPAPAGGPVHRVTLLTGDVVTVRERPGACPIVTVRPAVPGRAVSHRCDPAGHVHVVPADAAALIGRSVEPALFDVTTLIAQGLDDRRSPSIPVIAVGGALSRGLASARSLTSIGAVAGDRHKNDTARVRSAFARPEAGARLWLDRTVRAVPLPATAGGGAPAAAPAVTGRPARVAVVDTGVDARHPDLAGRVVEQADFTGAGDPADRNGHGTLVAGVIAGSGQASGGRYRGVAPQARLVSAKALGADGRGTVSGTIAAMQWAATRADVVNLSFGGLEPSDGADPLSLAVDALSAGGGPLFVTSAGNAGPADGTVTAPGAAASALTVGAIDGDGVLAPLSSRGPQPGTGALKPEVTAPGVDVVAARAAGTALGSLVDGNYTTVTGTSFAAPYVAGAAALLAGRHPGWAADRLKAALTGTARPGASAVDLRAALSRTVVPATGPVNLGVLDEGGSARVAWANAGRSEARLSLAAASADRAGRAGAVRLSAAELSVPAGGTAAVTLTVPAATAPGTYTATVAARHRDETTRVLVTYRVAPPTVDLTITATPLPGTGPDVFAATAYLVDLDDPTTPIEPVLLDGESVVVPVPAGRYSVLGEVWDVSGAGRVALAGEPSVEVAEGTVVRLDGARAVPFQASVEGVETEPESASVAYVQTPAAGQPFSGGVLGAEIAVTPGSGAAVDGFQVYAYAGMTSDSSRWDLVEPLGRALPARPGVAVTAAGQMRLARVEQRFHDRGGPLEFTRFGFTPEGVVLAASVSAPPAGGRTDYLSPGVLWADEAAQTLGVGEGLRLTSVEAPQTYAVASVTAKTWFGAPLRPDWHPGGDDTANLCQPAPVRRSTGNLHVELAALVDRHGRFDCLAYEPAWTEAVTSRLTLHRDGRLVGSVAGWRGDFAVPPASSVYRLTHEQDAGDLLPFSRRVTTTWQFRSSGAEPRPPLLSLDYDARPGGTAVTVRRSSPGPVTLTAWTSTDDGETWASARVDRAGVVALPTAAAVSLRVLAGAADGSLIDQTVIRAFLR